MKNIIHFLMVITVMIVSAGCGATAREIAKMSQSAKTDVFTDVVSEGPAPAGYADVVIKAPLKTPLAGHYPLESKSSARGKAVYPFVVNIDGQAVQWQVKGQRHVLPEYVDGKTSRDPEAGEGMKYMLEKKIRLAAGSHKIFLGLPEESQYTMTDISVKSGGLYTLELRTEYRYKTIPTRIPTFLKGVDKFDVVFKEVMVQDR